MTVSMRMIQPGRGYDYLLKSVVRGDANMADPQPGHAVLHRGGHPAGRWMGSGLHAFGDGEIKRGDMVTPQQLQLLIGAGLDPVTGEQLGGRSRCSRAQASAWPTARPNSRPTSRDEQREAAIAQIKAEESRKHQSGVAGFDFTFSVPEVRLGTVGRGRRWHAGAHRRGPPPGRRRGARLHGAGGRRHEEGRRRRRRGRDAGRHRRRRRHGVRPLGLPAR